MMIDIITEVILGGSCRKSHDGGSGLLSGNYMAVLTLHKFINLYVMDFSASILHLNRKFTKVKKKEIILCIWNIFQKKCLRLKLIIFGHV